MHVVVISGLVVSMLAIGSKVHGFRPGRGRWVFKCDEIRNTLSLGRVVEPSVPCKILQLVKKVSKYERDNY
jgi:hypothetical protein